MKKHRYGISVHNKHTIPMNNDLRLSRLDKKSPGNGNEWPWEKRYEVVTQMLAVGNKSLISKVTGVAYETISYWQKQPWWKELEDQVKREKSLKLDSKLTQIINKSLDLIADRLENGNTVLNNKTGELIRKPVELKDVSRVATDLLNRQHVINKTMVEEKTTEASVKETLALLANEFAKWASKEKKAGATDLPFVEVADGRQ